jgi:DNA-directed RNA polymerase specialized sigma24 family protein
VRLFWRRDPEAARDLTQSFFLSALEKNTFAAFDPSRARFRTYLRLCLDGFLSNQEKAARRLKRGGGAVSVPMDFDGIEAELHAVYGGDAADVERTFDRAWAKALFELAIVAFEKDCLEKNRVRVWRAFQRYDLADPPESRPSYGELARELGVPATTITNDLATGRRELRRILLGKLRELTASEDEFLEEARFLFGGVAGT